MPLDEETTRFAFLVQRELRTLAEREEAHGSRGEEVKYDPLSKMATYETRRGGVASRMFGELLATYATDDRIFRWAWAGRAAGADVTHADVVFHAGQTRGVPQLSMSIVADLGEEEATTLAKLGALASDAEGLHVLRSGTKLEFVGLFDRPRPSDKGGERSAGRFSVPPPPVAERTRDTPPPRRVPYRSLPPIREIYEPRTGSSPPRVARGSSGPPPVSAGAAAALREPARPVFLPVANAMLDGLARGCPGYRQGLFVVIVEEHRARQGRRLVVQLVAVDEHGLLRSVDAPTALVDAAAQMIDADLAEGNGAWRKLSARIVPKADGGATLHVDVV
jgi:hypothetical protein